MADVHQARHWYVTQIDRSIYETVAQQSEIDRRLRELIEYMGWRSGWETLDAYQHYFDPQRHAEIQNATLPTAGCGPEASAGIPGSSPGFTAAIQDDPVSPSERCIRSTCDLDPDSDLEYLLTLGGKRGYNNRSR